MNVFRSRKKSIGDVDASRPSLDNAPPLPKHNRNLFGRKKQQLETKKEELDISVALPSNDDFRTSLLMPNLAQRFSMLREQDDPRTKIGKASDDSVLFPKRESRLDLFGLGNLDDIAEVSSVTGSFRPPFAQEGRVTSYASDGYDGYASDTASASGSVMSRSRPGQGNKLFGGRQKVYKIPAAGPASKTNSRPNSSGNGMGKGMGRAVYEDDISSSLWQTLRAAERNKRSFDSELHEGANGGRLSPTWNGYNRNRETSSSTNSNERSSTAATSMTSMHDGSASGLPPTMTKELGRDRPLNKKMYGQSIDQQVHEQQNSAIQRLNSVRGGRSFGNNVVARSGTQRPGAASAASSLRSGSPSPALNSSSGFDFGLDKPAQIKTRDADSGYHGSSVVPSPISPNVVADSTLAAHLDPNDHGKVTASGAFNKPSARYDDQQFAQRQLQLSEGRDVSRGPTPRSDTPSDQASSRLRQGSDSSAGRATPLNKYSRFRGDRSMSRDSSGRHPVGRLQNGQAHLDNSDSDEYMDSSSPNHRGSNPSNALHLDEQHPALRAPITEEDETFGRHQAHRVFGSSRENHESLTLGRDSGELNSVVHGHLRARSDASSVYSETFPSHSAYHSQQNSVSGIVRGKHESQVDQSFNQATSMSEVATRTRADSSSQDRGLSMPAFEEAAHHTRSPSNDTLLERDAFADELADRRRQVEEKLRNIAESRANFDLQTESNREVSPGRGFSLLKKSSSKTSLANDANTGKMLKKLLPGPGPMTPSSEVEHDEISSPGRSNARRTSENRSTDPSLTRDKSSPRSPMRERDIGAERRARYAANMRPSNGSGHPVRSQVEARRQQFAVGVGAVPRDFTERIVSNPDQGKPHIHPAGRSRHYIPPRANTTPDQKPVIPPHVAQGSRSGSRPPTNTAPNERQIGNDRLDAMSHQSSFNRSQNEEQSVDTFLAKGLTNSDPISSHIFSPVSLSQSTNTVTQYTSARKRSVSKAEISSPINLVSSTYALSTVDLLPDASLENGMDEVRAADAANPPPVPPINPRRRAKGTLRKVTRSNTGSPESDGDRNRSPNLMLRKQASEGSNLRGRIREKMANPSSPHRNAQ